MFRWNDPDFVIIFESKTLFLQSHRPLLLHWQINENTARGAALFGRFLIFSTVSLCLKLSFSFSFFLLFYIFQHTVSWLFHISIFTRFLLSTYGTPQLSIALTARTQWYFAVWNWFDRQINCSWMSLCSRVMRLSLIILFDLFAACSCQIVFLPLHGTSVGMIAAEQDSEHEAHLEAGRRKPARANALPPSATCTINPFQMPHFLFLNEIL